jgi:hypothetical protein
MGSDEIQRPAEAVMINVPRFSASSFNVNMTPTEVALLGSAAVPSITPNGQIDVGLRPEVIISLSPHAAKELAYVLLGVISQFEKDFGELKTPFLSERLSK